MIPGIDVSHWQGLIDWKLVSTAGYKFAFLKASEFPLGKKDIWIDDTFSYNAQSCKLNNILFAPYHFYRTHIAPEVQAAGFLNAIKGIPYDLPPAVDLEVSGITGTAYNAQLMAFLSIVEAKLGQKVIIYTSGSFWRSYAIYDKIANVDWVIGHPLWVAQWSLTWPGPLYPFAGWHFWQFTDKGRVPGIKTFVDLNYFGSDPVELYKLCKAQA